MFFCASQTLYKWHMMVSVTCKYICSSVEVSTLGLRPRVDTSTEEHIYLHVTRVHHVSSVICCIITVRKIRLNSKNSQFTCTERYDNYVTTRDLQIIFFAFESNLESNWLSDSISNRIFESNRPYIPRKP